jgi:type II secretory ATPase GspE/PulE/Tfp pilus assembly ATPase PilB-like protein
VTVPRPLFLGDRLIDLRIATLPTSFGERVVLIQREHGLLLVTGPTGSGKSTTLYAALQEINAKGPQRADARGSDRVPESDADQ